MQAFRDILSARASNWAICLLSGSLIAVAVSHWTRPAPVSAQGGNGQRVRQMSQESRSVVQALEDAFVNIAETVEPSVVTITARSTPSAAPARPQQPQPNQAPELDLPEPFKEFDFFRRFPPRGDGPRQGPGESKGSGVILRESGTTVYVLTNNHVVEGRDRLRVQFYGREELPAELVGRDERTDLAVLKVQRRRPLQPGSIAQLGNSDQVKAGQWAIAIGSPLGYDSTLTVGVISAKNRKLDGLGRGRTNYVDLLQTDASINPGNSGGPLVNIEGKVIGINVAIAAPFGGQGNIGIGFAIPINTAREVADQLIATGKVVRGYLGVGTSDINRDLSPELREFLKVPDGGALCENVTPNTPAARGGLKDGDVIVKFGDRVITSFTDLEKAVGATRPGTTVAVEVVRDGKPVRLNITVTERPDEGKLLEEGRGAAPDAAAAPGQEPVKSKFGISVRPAQDGAGVEIAAITPGSPAAEAGLQVGDVIRSVDNTTVTDIASFQRAMNGLAANAATVLRVSTRAGLRFVVIRP